MCQLLLPRLEFQGAGDAADIGADVREWLGWGPLGTGGSWLTFAPGMTHEQQKSRGLLVLVPVCGVPEV